MVRDGGQLYTIEGIAAGLIMILTAFFVVNATSVYTAGDAHISDMQLEVLGSDALKMMDTAPDSTTETTPLQTIVEADQGDAFRIAFMNYTNNRTGSVPDHIQFTANISNRDTADNTIKSYLLSASRNLNGGEHAVRATRWVIVKKTLPPGPLPAKDRAVLVEVLLWRD